MKASSPAAPSLKDHRHLVNCSVTVFTQKYDEVRRFYLELLHAKWLEEMPHATYPYFTIGIGDSVVTFSKARPTELPSNLEFHIITRKLEEVLSEMRQAGVTIEKDGHRTKVWDPEKRIIFFRAAVS